MPCEIRLLACADAARYRELMLFAYERSPEAFTSTPAERAAQPLSWWEQRIAHPAQLSRVFAAMHQQALVGSVAVELSDREKTRHKAQLIALYVRPDWRGRGIAGALLTAALAWCRQAPGLRLVQLEVTEGNESATRLYRAHGFQPYGVEPMAVRSATGYLAKIKMWRELG